MKIKMKKGARKCLLIAEPAAGLPSRRVSDPPPIARRLLPAFLIRLQPPAASLQPLNHLFARGTALFAVGQSVTAFRPNTRT